MNFQEFRKYKDSIDDQASLLRLDCMNPFKAMSYMKNHETNVSLISKDDVLDSWAIIMGVQKYREIALASHGVRESLKQLFKYFSLKKKELWLPEDVYPFYWEASLNAGIAANGFSTGRGPDLTFLRRTLNNSVCVITNPISPLGRLLNKEEVNQIKEWLADSPDRQVVLDTVYDYTSGFDSLTIELFETGQCFIAHSLSKAWLERGLFGVLLAPNADRVECARMLEIPNDKACSSAFNALEKLPHLPLKQQAEFSKEWQRLLPDIQKLAPDFIPPASGYFAAIEVEHEKALNDFGALVIPASVFGSIDRELSIVTCLYDIGKHNS